MKKDIPNQDTIRSIRAKQSLTIREAADRSGLSETQWKLIERGLTTPNADLLSRIRSTLGLTGANNTDMILANGNNIGEGYVTSYGDAGTKFMLQPRITRKRADFEIIDLFCGAGGLSYGFEQNSNFKVACGVDLLADRVQTFHENHPNAFAICSDIKSLEFQTLNDITDSPSIVMGGPPCQGFSSIRPFRSLTEGDARNSLPEHYLLTVAQLKPKWVIFENVTGILSHRKGNVFDQVLSGLRDLGYYVDYKVINAASLGVPQNRERVYVIGRRGTKPFTWITPSHRTENRSMAGRNHPMLNSLPLIEGILQDPVTVGDAIFDLPEIRSGETAEFYKKTPFTNFQKLMRAESAEKLTLHHATKHTEKMMEIVRKSGKNRNCLPEHMTTSGFSSCYSRLDADAPSTTITVNFVNPSSNRCIHPHQHRALTPREGARLQSFPDHYIFKGSKTQITKQIGNAVPPMVSAALAKMILANT